MTIIICATCGHGIHASVVAPGAVLTAPCNGCDVCERSQARPD
jgi:hypothetical protein